MKIQKHSGQMTLIAIVMIMITMICYINIVYPILSPMIEEALPTMDTTTAIIVQIFLPLMMIMIILAMVYYVIPNREMIRR